MVDFNKQITVALSTGKAEFGCKKADEHVRTGKIKMLILASNCPERHKSKILHNAKLSKIPVYIYPGTSLELASICEKPFKISAISMSDLGNSEMLKLVEEKNA